MVNEIKKIDDNYKQALRKKVADLDEIYARRYSDHEKQLNTLKDNLMDKEKELQDALARIAALENDKATLQSALEDVKKDLEKASQAYKDADKELKDKQVKLIVEDLEPEFIKYDGLLMIEEKR
jgi:chromosome segregation ATPase